VDNFEEELVSGFTDQMIEEINKRFGEEIDLDSARPVFRFDGACFRFLAKAKLTQKAGLLCKIADRDVEIESDSVFPSDLHRAHFELRTIVRCRLGLERIELPFSLFYSKKR
jgi:hypothetical protein